MQCVEFREISESYLIDESLVEKDIQSSLHLEQCPNCMREFTQKKELRQSVKRAFVNAPEFQMNQFFAKRLNQNLRELALNENRTTKSWFAPKFLLSAMASLVLVAAIGLVFLNSNVKQTEPIVSQNHSFQEVPVYEDLTKISTAAVGNHQSCALQKLQRWEEMSKRNYDGKEAYTEKVANPLKANFSENVEMLHAHDCVFQGKKFNHVILKKGTQIASVLVDETDALPVSGNSEIKRLSDEKEGAFQIAGFQKGKSAIFFISDMTEAENMKAATAIRDFSEL